MAHVLYSILVFPLLHLSHVLRGENRIHHIKVVLKIKNTGLYKALRTVPNMSVPYIMCPAINC